MEVETAVVADSILHEEQSRSLWHYSWKRLKRNKLAMTGLVTLCILIFIALTAPLIAPFNPNMQLRKLILKEPYL